MHPFPTDNPSAPVPAPRRASRTGYALAVALLLAGTASAAAAPDLTADTKVANAGYYQLRWDAGADAAAEFELQESGAADFRQARVLYRGPDRATTISGRSDGDYHYRVRAHRDGTAGAWSEPVQVTVRHHPLARAFGFFAAGLVVFVATAAVIFRRRTDA